MSLERGNPNTAAHTDRSSDPIPGLPPRSFIGSMGVGLGGILRTIATILYHSLEVVDSQEAFHDKVCLFN